VGIFLDDWMDEHLHNGIVVSIALIVYGIAFILVERQKTGRRMRVIEDVHAIDYKTAILIGVFQCLSLVPGTSRSGSTILGAIMLGVGRSAGAEFSFFMAIPTMLGASAIKGLKFFLSGASAGMTEISVLIVGCVVSFIVSLLVIRGLMEYVRRHSFSAFGIYRIVLGIIVLAYFLIF
jgi:undecaprenyl-diphosphatase